MATDAGEDTFESVDWEALSGARAVDPWTAGFILAVGLLATAFAYDLARVPADAPLVLGWDVAALDWLTALSLLMLVFGVVLPLARDRRLARHYWRRLRTNRAAVASLAYLAAFLVLGLFGPFLVGTPEFGIGIHQPPFGVSVPSNFVGSCVGSTAGGACHGTLEHPLGTTGNGRDVLVYTLNGMHVALQVSLLVATIIVPVATTVGTVAAYFGGRVDAVLMRYVDLQDAIPPFFVYIVAQFLFTPTLLLMVIVFGALNWGGTARLVRSDALGIAEQEYVDAATEAGRGGFGIVRGHLVPNVSGTVLTAVTLQMPTLVLIEATLSYLDLGASGVWSWGNIIAVGVKNFPTYWWVTLFPVLAMALTIVAFNVLGAALRDVLDSRVEP